MENYEINSSEAKCPFPHGMSDEAREPEDDQKSDFTDVSVVPSSK
tara:strand:- start:39 stop:173 length:135 start_codon:yes stop_codon:yes gene_type:complete